MARPEQDFSMPSGGDELPTYDDLAAQNGPNSRFGRWRGWIEKRAAERYNEITPAERQRRRERGWGNDEMMEHEAYQEQAGQSQAPLNPLIVNHGPVLQISTSDLDQYPPVEFAQPPSPLPPLPPVSTTLDPTHLKLNQFGSRFLPHSTAPIRCLLPLVADRYLLVGHDEGLSVLDMYPQEWADTGALLQRGPEEAQARPIWTGQGVYQMTLLEVEEGDGRQQGVVLLLVGPEGDSMKESDSLRSLRMYNLASLTSLAKWAVNQKGAHPVDLRATSSPQQTPTKRHRPQSSIARSIKSFIDNPGHGTEPSSYQTLLSPTSTITGSSGFRGANHPPSPSPNRHNSDDSSWDVVDDLPLRWATDYVALAAAGSRLANNSVLSYAIWYGDNFGRRNGRLLAVATKTNILLYETPKGERAFRFVKEFYTPLQPRTVTFFQQSVQDVMRSASDAGISHRYQSHHRSESTTALRSPINAGASMNYGTQLSLFVIFDKKAGWIRIGDSAVGEMEWYDDGSLHPSMMANLSLNVSGSLSSVHRKSRTSFEPQSHLGKWISPAQCELPVPQSRASTAGPTTKKVHILTRGKQSQIHPSPLPIGSSAVMPLKVVNWKHPPSSVIPRILESLPTGPALQLVNLGAHGVEVQEISLGFLSKGKGKATGGADEALWAEEDIGGDTGFLCTGGHWDDPRYSPYNELSRSMSTASDMSGFSALSLSSDEMIVKMRKQEGVYSWCRKGVADYRVFWLGGS